jgi:hypothetical protein
MRFCEDKTCPGYGKELNANGLCVSTEKPRVNQGGIWKARELIGQMKWYAPAARIEMYVGWMQTAASLKDYELLDALRSEVDREIEHVKDMEGYLARA